MEGDNEMKEFMQKLGAVRRFALVQHIQADPAAV